MANIGFAAAELPVQWSYRARCSGGEDLQVSQGSSHKAHGCGQSVQSTQRKQHFLGEETDTDQIKYSRHNYLIGCSRLKQSKGSIYAQAAKTTR